MKELKKYFEHYVALFPNLSAFMCFGKACKQVQPTARVLRTGFREMIPSSDYSAPDIKYLLVHLDNMAQHRAQ